MKALRFYAPEDVRLEEVPEPECGPDEIKLRVRNCSTCGTACPTCAQVNDYAELPANLAAAVHTSARVDSRGTCGHSRPNRWRMYRAPLNPSSIPIANRTPSRSCRTFHSASSNRLVCAYARPGTLSASRASQNRMTPHSAARRR